MTPYIYANLYATAFASPANPRAAIAYFPNATGIKQVATQYKFDKINALFGLKNNVDKASKLQILVSVDRIYTQALKAK